MLSPVAGRNHQCGLFPVMIAEAVDDQHTDRLICGGFSQILALRLMTN